MTQQEKSSSEDDIIYWKNIGDNYFKEGDYLSALDAYQTVIRTDRKNLDAWKGVATVFSLLNKHYEALESLDKAIEIDPTDIESLEIKGLILEKLLEENQEEINRLKS
ncbi:MAG: Tetratricopeptide repeat protein [Methanobacterium sp. PtaU1.Bin242]|nr:MAG: Tetratricopeptide repeat protein [Methanobacterium sp. PtaU1.Bin242]